MFYYSYDGSFEGFLSVVYEKFLLKDYGKNIVLGSGRLMEKYIETDIIRTRKVYEKIIKCCGLEVYERIKLAFFSEEVSVEDTLFEYIYNLLRGKNLNNLIKIERYAEKTIREAHRFKGFVRFERLTGNRYFAKISPSCNILSLIGYYFIKRFKEQDFIIYDEIRGVQLVYLRDKRVSYIESVDNNYCKGKDRALGEKEYAKLWRVFYDSIAIDERISEKRRSNRVPKKYWEDLTELKNAL